MQFETFSLKNFRNFKETSINLGQKNIILGINNVGKSNLIFGLRLLLDKDLRTYEIQETDYFQKNIEKPIEIILKISYCVKELDDDVKKILAQMKEAVTEESGFIFIKQTIKFNNDIDYRIWEWGSSIEKLQIIKGTTFYTSIYNIFNVVHMSATANIDASFKKEKNNFFKKYMLTNSEIQGEIGLQQQIKDFNEEIVKLPKIVAVTTKINETLKKFDSGNYDITLESDIKVNGINSQLRFFMKDVGSDEVFPIAGDGVKKKASYAFLDLVKQEENEEKIFIYLFEEPENYLFYASHFDLAKKLINSTNFRYVFIVTHSPIYINTDFTTHANIIKLIKSDDKIVAESVFLDVPSDLFRFLDKYVSDLAVAMFYDTVLLVEGYSEELLFNYILSSKGYNREKVYVLKVLSTNFKPYIQILTKLKIKCYIKTDNDIRIFKDNEIEPLGFNRAIELYRLMPPLDDNNLESMLESAKYVKDREKIKDDLYSKNSDLRNELLTKKIWISTQDLENDILSALGEKRLKQIMNIPKTQTKDVASKLREKKWHNMVDLIQNLENDDINKIIDHASFSFLKELTSDE